MNIILEIGKKDLSHIAGGKSCTGVWLGTSDGKYGLCVGKSAEQGYIMFELKNEILDFVNGGAQCKGVLLKLNDGDLAICIGVMTQ